MDVHHRVDPGAHRDLLILTEIAEGRAVTQRGLSQSLGIALGLTNLYIKRLARKGYIKITTIPPNRLRYLVTPKGLAEKSRLTFEYMRLSLSLFQQTRQVLRGALEPAVTAGMTRFALYGVGEAAELAYLTLREFGLEPVAVYADGASDLFLGLRVRPAAEVATSDADRVIVALFDANIEMHLANLGRALPQEKLVLLHKAPQAPLTARG
jgi:hypothetical protein